MWSLQTLSSFKSRILKLDFYAPEIRPKKRKEEKKKEELGEEEDGFWAGRNVLQASYLFKWNCLHLLLFFHFYLGCGWIDYANSVEYWKLLMILNWLLISKCVSRVHHDFFSDILKQKSVNLNLLFGYFEAKFGTNLSRKLAKIVIKIKFFAWFFYTKDDVITIYVMVFIILIYMNIILFDFYGTKMVNNKSIYRHLSLK